MSGWGVKGVWGLCSWGEYLSVLNVEREFVFRRGYGDNML